MKRGDFSAAMNDSSPFQATNIEGRWKNSWKPWERPGLWKLIKWWWEKNTSDIPKNEKDLNETLPLVTPQNNPANYAKLWEPPSDGVQVMWIGHASVLVQFDGITILTDPVFADRCNPFYLIPWLPIGTWRYRRAPCTVNDLPEIDAVIISHDHYDHLCYDTVQKLNVRYGDKITWYVPMDLKTWFTDSGCKKVEELKWWEERKFEVNGKKFQFISTPCQHWCMRKFIDENKALWCSWVVKGPRHTVLFAGDTGYHQPLFKYIGDRYGPFSLAMIPIGAYKPRWMMEYQHVNPEEAFKIHADIKAKHSIGIHWGTFYQTNEYYLEPKFKLKEMQKQLPDREHSFITLNHGEVRDFKDCSI